MKKTISTLFLASIISFVAIAQEKATINWLNTSQFDKAIKKQKQNVFIFIEGNRIQQEERMPKEELEQMKKHMFGFLEDAELIKYLNENFVCYKFNPASESVKFQGKEYKKTEERGRISHEFTNILTGKSRNRVPAIVIRDKNFQLFEYKKALPKTEEMKVLLEAEKLKVNYIKEKLGENSKYLEESAHMLKRHEELLKREEANKDKKSKSVFGARQNAKRLTKTLTYFVSGTYKNTDLETYNKN
jgi:hypothetical protein